MITTAWMILFLKSTSETCLGPREQRSERDGPSKLIDEISFGISLEIESIDCGIREPKYVRGRAR